MRNSRGIVAFVDETYDAVTFEQLKTIAEKSVARAIKQHSLRSDPQIFTPSVCRRGRLRYDLQLPPRSVASLDVSSSVTALLEQYLGNDYKSKSPHCLVAFAGAEAQDWHTDVDPLFAQEEEAGAEYKYPPFYFTLITALDDVDDERMGPTEFENGQKALLKKNQSVLFDGLTLHRGGAALVDRPPLVYRVFHRRWYCDANEKGL